MTVVQTTVVQTKVVKMTVGQTTVVQTTKVQTTVAQSLKGVFYSFQGASKTKLAQCDPAIFFSQLPDDLLKAVVLVFS